MSARLNPYSATPELMRLPSAGGEVLDPGKAARHPARKGSGLVMTAALRKRAKGALSSILLLASISSWSSIAAACPVEDFETPVERLAMGGSRRLRSRSGLWGRVERRRVRTDASE